ncbi:MAG: glycosyltransferase [Planctomycetes bacterium]|nr:glycosyltransferase [Planctomycetota bacterium]
MDLSIVIPSYNEGSKIVRDIEAAGAFLGENKLVGEIIVVDDGSEDDTAGVAEKTQVSEGMGKKVIRFEKNRGKGYAVRAGITATNGDYVMFADSGVCVPYQFALKGLELLRSGLCEIAHGSRKLPESAIVHTHYVHRQVSSKLFRWLAVHYAGIPDDITDSQCGFKMYRGDVGRELYGECQSERFMFDVEIILRATRKGHRILEFPIEWKSDRDTRFRFFSASVGSMLDLRTVKRILKKETTE